MMFTSTQLCHRSLEEAPQTSYHDPHYFFTLDDKKSIAEIFKQSHSFFIELGEYIHLRRVLKMIRTARPDFCLSLTSATAYRQPVAEFLTHYFDDRITLTQTAFDNIKTCLQEAIMNAVIHGNLNLYPKGNTAQDFQHYFDAVSQRLNDAEFSLRRVSIFAWFAENALTLCIADQGKGFDLMQPDPALTALHGRGLPIIRAMSQRVWQTHANHVYMKFAW